jgi:hypothetical protein
MLRLQGLLATARSQSQPGMFTFWRTQFSLLPKGRVGTKLGTVKIMLTLQRATERPYPHDATRELWSGR